MREPNISLKQDIFVNTLFRTFLGSLFTLFVSVSVAGFQLTDILTFQ